jgi:hypothetical protein
MNQRLPLVATAAVLLSTCYGCVEGLDRGGVTGGRFSGGRFSGGRVVGGTVEGGACGGVFGWSNSGCAGRPVGGNTVAGLFVPTRVAVVPKRSCEPAPVAVLPRRSCEPAPVAVPPIVPAPPAAVLVATLVAVVFVGTAVAVVPMFVVDVLVPPRTVVPFVVAAPVTLVEPVPPAPAAVAPTLLKNCNDG